MTSRGFHVFVLWGFAGVLPVITVLFHNPQFFVAHGATTGEILAFLFLLAIGVPLVAMMTVILVGRVSAFESDELQLAIIATLVALLVLPWLEGIAGLVQILVAVALGGLAGLVYHRSTAVRTYLSILAPTPLVIVASFLLFSEVGELIWDENEPSPDLGTESEIPIVLLSFDELPLPTLLDASRQIDKQRYPNFAALASTSTWYRRATTVSDLTRVALPALLTGRYVSESGVSAPVANASNYPQTLITWLSGSRVVNIVESRTALCPKWLCEAERMTASDLSGVRDLAVDALAIYLHRLLPSDLSGWLPAVDDQWADFALFGDRFRSDRGSDQLRVEQSDDHRVRKFNRFLASIAEDVDQQGSNREAGAFHWHHNNLPHVPWRFLPSGVNYAARGTRQAKKGPGIHREVWGREEWPIHQALQRYLLQLGFVDRLLGRFLEALEQYEIFDSALVIVTADHGASFRPGLSRRNPQGDNLVDIASIPLFVKLPHQRRGMVSDRNVESIDIAPTIVDLLGLDQPWQMDGVSLLGPARAHGRKQFFSGLDRIPMTFDSDELGMGFELTDLIAELFGPSSDPLSLFRVGPFPELVGRALSELRVEENMIEETVHIRHPSAAARVEVGAVPARVNGFVDRKDPISKPLRLAISVDQKVWATTRTLRTDSRRAEFFAMIPEAAFDRDGMVVVEIFRVIENAEGLSLTRIDSKNSSG